VSTIILWKHIVIQFNAGELVSAKVQRLDIQDVVAFASTITTVVLAKVTFTFAETSI
jgi:hypothetical protein